MPKTAFGSLRVRESLEAVANYLDDAARIAGGIPPGQVIGIELEETSNTVGPRLHKVRWVSTGARTIELGSGKTSQELAVVGTNLENVQTFKLVKSGSDRDFTARKITPDVIEEETRFTAAFELDDPPIGSYHAFVIDEIGQTYLLPDACSIQPLPAKPATTTALTVTDVHLGGLEPNHGRPGDSVEAVLILLDGEESDLENFEITDDAGQRVPGFGVQRALTFKGGGATEYALQHYHYTKRVCLNIGVPAGEKPRSVRLVATSKKTGAKVTLAFHVRNSLPPSTSRASAQ